MTLDVRMHLIKIMRKCMEIKEIDKRIELVQYLNNILPSKYKFQIPSFITNDWINNRLYSLEEEIFRPSLIFQSED